MRVDAARCGDTRVANLPDYYQNTCSYCTETITLRQIGIVCPFSQTALGNACEGCLVGLMKS